MQIHLDSIGCRLNHCEMEDLARQLAGRGHRIVDAPEEADILILNTCTVTQEAARKSRQAARRLHRANPRARLFITGCYATLSPIQAGAIDGVTQVVGNQQKQGLLSLLAPHPGPAGPPVWRLPTGRTRAFVKIQDGCDNRCTYCVTTIARGASRSRPAREILTQIQHLVAAGYQEVVLTGVHVGNYGHEKGRETAGMAPLKQLVTTILAETSLPRLRLSSLEPWHLDEGFLGLWDNPRLCRQLHLPLQSGSASVLRRMARRTTPDAFHHLACAALKAIPDLALTTDLIVGFPGESRTEFEESLDFASRLDFARLHVFAFSPRPGTIAAGLPDQLPKGIIQERSNRMRALGAEKARTFMQRFVGRTMEVLWESSLSRPGQPLLWRGHTDNYIPVHTSSDHSLHNTMTSTELAELQNGGLKGILLEPTSTQPVSQA